MAENKLFIDFKKNHEIYLAHVNAPVKLDDYIQALNKWVKAKRYNRALYLDSNTYRVKVPSAAQLYPQIADLEATFGAF